VSPTERLKALRNLPQLFRLIWAASPPITLANLLLRLARAAIPLATPYVGKLIINEVVCLTQTGGERDLAHLWTLVATEFGIALLADVLSRGIALLDSLQAKGYR
jgi:ATP-binding cassette subfamily B protein